MVSFPQEIIDYIIDYVVEGASTPGIAQVLILLSRISKTWRIAASRRLYSTVYIGRSEKASLLRRTLRQSRFLASLINKLILATSGDRSDRAFIELLQLCLSTRHLELSGYTPQEPDRFTECLTRLPLATFHLNLTSSDHKKFLFRNSTAFMQFLQSLPKIEKVVSRAGLFPALLTTRLEPFTSNRTLSNHTCQNLDELTMTETEVFSEEGLKALRLLSLPRLRVLALAYGGARRMDDILIECLDSWTNLEELTLNRKIEDQPKSSSSYVEAFSRRSKLKKLSLTKPTISLTDLSRLPSDISIFVLSYILDKANIDCLASELAKVSMAQERSLEVLPRLKILMFYSGIEYHEFKLHPIVNTCNSRSISLSAFFYTHAGPGRRYYRWNKIKFDPPTEKSVNG